MKQRSGNRFLAWALGLSIGVHVVIAVVLREMPPVEAADQPAQHTTIVRIPPPTPTPRPVPPRTPHAMVRTAVAVRPAIAAPHTTQTGGTHSAGQGHTAAVVSPGVGDGTDLPGTPAPTPHPACSNPNEPAHTVNVVAPEQPDDASVLPATAQVEVTLDAAGRVLDTSIYRSTNEMALDRAALLAARQSTYAPALVDCQPTGGQYLFRVDFQQ